ncbi:MAG: DUF971 family protein [Phenylobacterium sp.]|jgi:DUF971 family protein
MVSNHGKGILILQQNNEKTMSITIKSIKYHQQQRTLDVVFADDTQATFSAEFLRVHSPSAEVQGHGPGQQVLVSNKKAVAISKIDQVGNYAIKIHFDDGHNSGIFSWVYLDELKVNQSALWQDYLAQLKAARRQRDAMIPIQLK